MIEPTTFSWVQPLPGIHDFWGLCGGIAVGCPGNFLLVVLAPEHLVGPLLGAAQCCFPFLFTSVGISVSLGKKFLSYLQINSETTLEGLFLSDMQLGAVRRGHCVCLRGCILSQGLEVRVS